ncbi:MAG: hypothetical protein Q9195_006757 [Heterodermia aff. obscurata]
MYFPNFAWSSLIAAIFFTTSFGIPVKDPSLKKYAAVPTLVKAPVFVGAGTYPRANKLSNGSLILSYTAFENGDNIIRVVLSTDNGKTWKIQGDVARGPSNANDIDNPYILQLPSGRLIVAFRNHSKDPSNGSYTYFRITICYSDDLGKSWLFLSEPAANSGPVNGLWEPFLRNALDGSLQLYYSRENAFDDQDTLERFSTDGGATWSAPQTISGVAITSRDGMTGVATVSGSTLIAVFETSIVGTFNISAITSTDDGKTWGGRRIIYTPTSPNTSAGAPQVLNVAGALAVSFITNEDDTLTAPAPNYALRTTTKLITSGDGGKTWGNKITVGQPHSVWPGLVGLNGKKFLVLFDNGGVKAQKIKLSK